ncbi:hypothetical protein M0R45_033245 [Rubus argutus]|uniref:Endonuclease/exonuclease/phosphatase domain-containing protein n=1 Tax=Rubus argutus TaxID=59490 RepID=A0AAW1WLU7_RUBAR
MNFLSWNCQGLGQPVTVQHLQEVTRSHGPLVVFLSETHQSGHYVDKVRKQLGYYKGVNVNPIDTSGGLSLWWKPAVMVDVILSSSFFIDTIVTFKDTGIQFRISWLYGPPYYSDKASFWDSWNNQNWNDSMPWLVMGDLNELLWSCEKEGGAPWNINRNRFLKDFMDSNNLIDVGYHGSSFTWYRSSFGEITLKERLDRGLINEDWLLLWPDSCVTHLALIGSDHCPLLFGTNPVLEKRKKPFKFEAFWADDTECHSVILDSWRCTDHPCNLALWRQNLSSCQNQLSKWSHNRFSANRALICDLLSELESDLLSSSPDVTRRNAITRKLDSLWSIEEKIWHQKSRINWLQAGDKNTHFFHLTTLHRRQRNRILKIANENGDWIVGERAIRCEFETQFKKVYSSSSVRNWGDSLSVVTSVVSPVMNATLTAPFSLDEVKAAAFQMGALKSPGTLRVVC